MKEQNLFSATAALQAVLALQPGALYTVSTVFKECLIVLSTLMFCTTNIHSTRTSQVNQIYDNSYTVYIIFTIYM